MIHSDLGIKFSKNLMSKAKKKFDEQGTLVPLFFSFDTLSPNGKVLSRPTLSMLAVEEGFRKKEAVEVLRRLVLQTEPLFVITLTEAWHFVGDQAAMDSIESELRKGKKLKDMKGAKEIVQLTLELRGDMPNFRWIAPINRAADKPFLEEFSVVNEVSFQGSMAGFLK